jgi:hypothetical protein
VTFSIDPILGDDLLPTTFRRMVTNDIAEQFGWPLTEALEQKSLRKELKAENQKAIRLITRLNDLLILNKKIEFDMLIFSIKHSNNKPEYDSIIASPIINDRIRSALSKTINSDIVNATNSPFKLSELNLFKRLDSPAAATLTFPKGTKPQVTNFSQVMLSSSLNFSIGIDNRIPIPTSQMFDAYGEAFVYEILFATQQAIGPDALYREYVHLPDIQSFLKEESKSAMQFLAKHPELMKNYCTAELVNMVRSRNAAEINKIRVMYRQQVEKITNDL